MTARSALATRDGALALDAEGRYRLVLTADGAPASAFFDGNPVPLAHDGRGARLAVLPADTPLKALIQLLRQTGHPVLLTDGQALCGACGPGDVIRALAAADGAAKQANAAN